PSLHQRSLQAKQRTLLQQLSSLDQEREELQVSLGEAEEDRARLQGQLQESREQALCKPQHFFCTTQELLDALQQEKLGLEGAVSGLQEDVSRLEEQARELQERERLLVFFPELHVPTEAQFESTGSLTEDMKRQLQANSIRIGVLEQENARLGAALGKVKAAAQEGVLKVRMHQPGPPSRRDSAETQGRTGTKGHAGTLGCTGDTGQRVPSSQRAKPPWAEPTGKAECCPLLVAEGLVLSRPEPRGRARPLSSPHAGGHRR
uniref:Uncharacterized protein n=1 Tax=Amazona collaria TaxID=241587 RepID=A0A8B9J2M7_9PSIT